MVGAWIYPGIRPAPSRDRSRMKDMDLVPISHFEATDSQSISVRHSFLGRGAPQPAPFSVPNENGACAVRHEAVVRHEANLGKGAASREAGRIRLARWARPPRLRLACNSPRCRQRAWGSVERSSVRAIQRIGASPAIFVGRRGPRPLCAWRLHFPKGLRCPRVPAPSPNTSRKPHPIA